MLNDMLQKLGFSKKEIQVYATLLKARRATPAQISKTTHINRPTVYSVAKSLVTKGFVTEDIAGKTLHLMPVQPEELKRVIKKEERALKEKESLMERMIEELSRTVVGAEYPVPKIRFVEEEDVEDYLYDHAKTWQDSADKIDGTTWGFQDHSFAELYQGWIDFLWKKIMRSTGSVKLLSNRSTIEDRLHGKYPRREIKFWEKSQQFSVSTWVIGDYLIMTSTTHHPFYLVEFHDAALAHNLREVFKNLWETI